MREQDGFLKEVCALAIPVTLQSMLQSSFSIVDQIMIGQLGDTSVAGVGLAAKFSSIYSVIISAIGAVAGIMLAQYLGQRNPKAARRGFFVNLWLGVAIAAGFTAASLAAPGKIMGLYIQDDATRNAAAEYLFLLAGTYFPLAGATLLSVLLRCAERARLPLYAGIAAAVLNTGLNYILIFGKAGAAPMGAQGAAIATVVSQWANFLVMLILLPKKELFGTKVEEKRLKRDKMDWKQYLTMLVPILVCEVAWSLGENVYAMIYGHMGTAASAAMTLTGPIQGLMTGALCGLSQAAGVLVGKRLGGGEYDRAYTDARRLLGYGAAGAVALAAVVFAVKGKYVEIYQVDRTVKELTGRILSAYALVAPFKVLNMILGGGILRSGGKTQYAMGVDLMGTWCFGVPLGLLGAFVLELPIERVYFLLSLEECVRFGASLVVFRGRRWMNRLSEG